MFRHKSPDPSFADRTQGMVPDCQPMGEVRNAANNWLRVSEGGRIWV
jgi:hypothetical protein